MHLDTSGALEALAGLAAEEVMVIVGTLVERGLTPVGELQASSGNPNTIKLFLVQYLLNHLNAALTPQQLQYFTTKELGLKVSGYISQNLY